MGAQRMASLDTTLPPPRHHEFVIERQGKEKGYEIFTPSYWATVIHHRKKTILTKRFPLFVGYSFVDLPDYQFEKLRENVEGVLCILKNHAGPVQFPPDTISRLVFNDWQEKQEMLFAVHEREELERQQKITQLRAKLRKIMPKGRAVRVNLVDQAEKKIDSLPPKTREYARDLLNQLHGLTVVETVGEAA